MATRDKNTLKMITISSDFGSHDDDGHNDDDLENNYEDDEPESFKWKYFQIDLLKGCMLKKYQKCS